jgi:transposase InsO family protein
VLTEVLAGYYRPDEHGRRPPESLYGSLKMWFHLQRQGIIVTRCTVERLMRANGWTGVTRTRVGTTVADSAADRAPDLVDRQFRVPAPNELLVADFTYVLLRTGAFAYTAFAIHAYAYAYAHAHAGAIIGWQYSMPKATALVTRTIAQATRTRARQGHRLSGRTIHHSDAGSPYPRHRDGPCRVIGVARTPRPSR